MCWGPLFLAGCQNQRRQRDSGKSQPPPPNNLKMLNMSILNHMDNKEKQMLHSGSEDPLEDARTLS